MSNQELVNRKKVGFYVFGVILAVVTGITFLTHAHRDTTAKSWFLAFAITYHTWIMAILVLLSIGFGYFWAFSLYKEIETRDKTSKNMIDVILLFLGIEEKKILKHLVSKKGTTTQADISRIEGMNKVKAHRSLQKLQDKQILIITPHGKVRNIQLKEDILDILVQGDNKKEI